MKKESRLKLIMKANRRSNNRTRTEDNQQVEIESQAPVEDNQLLEESPKEAKVATENQAKVTRVPKREEAPPEAPRRVRTLRTLRRDNRRRSDLIRID